MEVQNYRYYKMPTPTTSYNLGITISGGTNANNYVDIRNGRTGEKFSVLSLGKEAKANLGNTKEFPSGVANGDVIELNVTGSRYGGNTHVVDTSKGGAKIKITVADVSSTTHPKVSV